MKTTPIGPFLGLNNRLPDTELFLKDKGFYLSIAENIDINNAGKIKRREAEVLVQAMTGAHSMFESYLVRDSVLYTYTMEPYAETFAKSLTSNARMSWHEEGADIYYSNGTDSGRITGGTFYPLGLPTPVAPTVSTTTGTLMAGTYQVAVSYYNNVTGEEGGVSPSNNPVLATVGGLVVTLPAPATGATHGNVYLSTVNGSVPFLAGTYVTGTASATFSAMPATTREAPQRFEAPLPAGRLFFSNGRLCSFSDNRVYVGLPYRYGYYDIVAGWIEFNDPVTVGAANQLGTYVATEVNTYWLPGDLGDVKDTLTEPFPFGGVLGTEWRHPATTDIGWFSENGFIVANTQGQAVPVTFDVLDIDTVPVEGCSNVRWTDGYVRVYSCGYCLNLESNAVTEYLGYDFTSFAGDYGTKADGVYVLTGGPDIAWRYGLGKQNFGSEAIKYMPAIYLGCSSPEPLSVRIKTADGDDYDYEARSCSDTIKQHRVDPGLGLESNWFDLELFGKSDFTLASISFAPTASTRRI